MIGPAKRERLAMMAIAGGLLAALSLRIATAPERPAIAGWETRRDAAPRAGAMTLAETEAADCGARIAAAMREGLILRRPAAQRIDVDRERWTKLSARRQGQLLQALTCDRRYGLNRQADVESVAHDAKTGRRISTMRRGLKKPPPERGQ